MSYYFFYVIKNLFYFCQVVGSICTIFAVNLQEMMMFGFLHFNYLSCKSYLH